MFHIHVNRNTRHSRLCLPGVAKIPVQKTDLSDKEQICSVYHKVTGQIKTLDCIPEAGKS